MFFFLLFFLDVENWLHRDQAQHMNNFDRYLLMNECARLQTLFDQEQQQHQRVLQQLQQQQREWTAMQQQPQLSLPTGVDNIYDGQQSTSYLQHLQEQQQRNYRLMQQQEDMFIWERQQQQIRQQEQADFYLNQQPSTSYERERSIEREPERARPDIALIRNALNDSSFEMADIDSNASTVEIPPHILNIITRVNDRSFISGSVVENENLKVVKVTNGELVCIVRDKYPECAVCLNEFDKIKHKPHTFKCGHIFCKPCIRKMCKKVEKGPLPFRYICPTCKKSSSRPLENHRVYF